MKGMCEKCGLERHVGPFKTADRTYTALCGPCKVKMVFTPENAEKLTKEMTEAFGTPVQIDFETSNKPPTES